MADVNDLLVDKPVIIDDTSLTALPPIPKSELVKLGAVDTEFYGKTFFPKTFRQKSPEFAPRMWAPLEDTSKRMVNLIAFRGAAKTTRLRLFASKRLAYGVSRTILYIGASERDAIRSVQWLRGNVERNSAWRDTFGLRPGKKWEETQIEIEHTGFGHTVWVLGAGITGSLRGINFDDYRPDLIILDDPQTDETAATQEQREKLADLIFGAVRNSLAPAADEPNAKLAMCITPQHDEDISQQALKDPEWHSEVIPCWTPETIHKPVDAQESAWPERFPSEDFRNQKKNAVRRNKLSVWMREMECALIAKESAIFMPQWLKVRAPNSEPRGYPAVLAIDPVPPPSPRQMAKGLENKDYEAHYVWARVGDQYHLLDRRRSRGHDPSWTIATAFSLMRQWRCMRIVFDAVAYQRTLQWILEDAMKRNRVFYQVVGIADGMAKFARINSVLNPLATRGLLNIGPEHTEFAEQFEHYGPLYAGIDDDIDASALALQDLSNPFLEDMGRDGQIILPDSHIEEIEWTRGAP